MLSAMSPGKYEVTVFLMARDGVLYEEIPSWVTVKCIYGDYQSTLNKLIDPMKKGDVNSAVKNLFYTVKGRTAKSVFEKELCDLKMMPIQPELFDIAIAYHVPASLPALYVVKNIKSKKKVAWIHSDVSVYKQQMKRYDKYYFQFDKIYCVSKFGDEKFIEMYSDLIEKTDVFYNIINEEDIHNKAELSGGFDDDFAGLRLLTVGRLSDQKGQDLIPEILKSLKADENNVRWYCIGEGETMYQLEEKIKLIGLEESCILLGNKMNPYPFFKYCDIYVQPSRHEGYCITLAEARVFNKPVVTTDFVGAREQIKNNETGLIVNFDAEALYQSIACLINNKGMRKSFSLALSLENKSKQNNLDCLFN
jgi:glycosyltransferase involved in cell wall biosynthesis